MKKQLYSLLLIFASIVLSSCISTNTSYTTNTYNDIDDYNTYIAFSEKDININRTTDKHSPLLVSIPAGKQYIAKKSKLHKDYLQVKYDGAQGYVKMPKKTRFTLIPASSYDLIEFSTDYGYYIKDTVKYVQNKSIETENYSKSTYSGVGSGGTVHVKGYTRKDGTYVRPHTRSAPKSRSSYRSSGRR